MGGFGFFAALATFIAIYSPKRLNQVTPRTDFVDPIALDEDRGRARSSRRGDGVARVNL